jgi:FkbM family methyltransferase
MNAYDVGPECQIRGLGELYYIIFGDIANGKFVDVGGYDGFTYSNTYGLALKGWSGIVYEPDPENYAKCVNTYKDMPHVKVINKAIGAKQGHVPLWLAGAGSTADAEQVKLGRPEGQYDTKTVMVDMSRLDFELVYRSMFPPIDVVSIDVEGGELDVLAEFCINYWKPNMVIIEAHELNPWPQLNRHAAAINAYFDAAGYHKHYSDDINNIYLYREI